MWRVHCGLQCCSCVLIFVFLLYHQSVWIIVIYMYLLILFRVVSVGLEHSSDFLCQWTKCVIQTVPNQIDTQQNTNYVHISWHLLYTFCLQTPDGYIITQWYGSAFVITGCWGNPTVDEYSIFCFSFSLLIIESLVIWNTVMLNWLHQYNQ